jgi:hypothetical protein
MGFAPLVIAIVSATMNKSIHMFDNNVNIANDKNSDDVYQQLRIQTDIINRDRIDNLSRRYKHD